MKRRGARRSAGSSTLPIVGGGQPAFRRSYRRVQQPFTYNQGGFANFDAILETIIKNPHPTDVLADASVFSPERMDIVRHLLISMRVRILPPVEAELLDMHGERTKALRDLLFPDGKLNPLLQADDYGLIRQYEWVATKLASLLHIRKRLLERPLQRFRAEHGRDATGPEKHAITQRLIRAGIGSRGVRLANKGDKRRRATDELLAVCGVLGPILTGRDCFLLTADSDIFDQVYQLSHFVHDDYGSFLIAEDLRNHPERYPHAHPMEHPAMEPGAIAYGRLQAPEYLLPSVYLTCASWVIDVATRRSLSWVATRDIGRGLAFQNSAKDGRVADGGDGRNVHMSLNDKACQHHKRHFTVGRDKPGMAGESPFGRIVATMYDVFRAIVERRPLQRGDLGTILMPGLPRL